MSHGDTVTALPPGGEWSTVGATEYGPHAVIANEARRLYGVQFHPESIASEQGHALLANFLELAGLPVRRRNAVSPRDAA